MWKFNVRIHFKRNWSSASTKTMGEFSVFVLTSQKPSNNKKNPSITLFRYHFTSFFLFFCMPIVSMGNSRSIYQSYLPCGYVFAIQEKAHESETYLFRSTFFGQYIREIIGLLFNAINVTNTEVRKNHSLNTKCFFYGFI